MRSRRVRGISNPIRLVRLTCRLRWGKLSFFATIVMHNSMQSSWYWIGIEYTLQHTVNTEEKEELIWFAVGDVISRCTNSCYILFAMPMFHAFYLYLICIASNWLQMNKTNIEEVSQPLISIHPLFHTWMCLCLNM